jgi:hypothetical protein
MARGKGGGVVSNDVGAGAVASSTSKTDGQRLYNFYAVHNIVIDIKGKGFFSL